MENSDRIICSLEKAKKLILRNIPRLQEEIVTLGEALQRVIVSDVLAALPRPSFDESTRDGYVISLFQRSDKGAICLKVVDEIPAGKPRMNALAPGNACKIMTGGCVPKGGERVIPYESCIKEKGEIIIADHLLQSARTFISKTGSEIARGDTLVRGGVLLQAAHLELLSSCGVDSVGVSSRPSAGYLCTGSELTNSPGRLERGQKVSSNSFLLAGNLASFGAFSQNMGIVEDTLQDLLVHFEQARSEEFDILISTGGMGPGKYDLVEGAFVEAGGNVIFNSITMRPGKALLFGTLGRTLFFGLPGPSFAVRTLFNELVGPALLAMQGMQGRWPRKRQAFLQHQIEIKRNTVLRLKDGIFTLVAGKGFVRFAGKLEIPNCHILLPPERTNCEEGELVDVHLAVTPFCQNTIF